jgi:hypothetical protein
MPVTCGFTSYWYPLKGISAGQTMIICVRGGLEPLAYILHSSADTWLDLPTQAVEP